ncbi:protein DETOXIFICATION 55-like [Diospyros lotus]|uniref:protein DETOXIFICATION 55-like n=1 Tax=Diospyros lotus TaxID=55363 RepID=UPI00225A6087|nr:protein DETOXIFICATION 55-like [Diospyros lotus]
MATEETQKQPTMPEVVEELKIMTDIGFPIMAMGLVGYFKNMILVVCMGRLGSLELAGGALAIGFTNITGYSILSGLAMGMEPICSQAIGSRNLALVSLTLQRTILMLLLASLPIGLLWFKLEYLMLMLHQNPDITHIASLYCRYAIPDLIANSLLHPLRIYLRSKGTTWPLMWCTSISVLLHLPITMVFAFSLHLGVAGLAISTFITNFNTLFFLLGYIIYTHNPNKPMCQPLIPQMIPLSSTSIWKEWVMLLQLAIPSCLAICLEWWWYEFMTLLAGYVNKPHVALATSAIVIQTTSLMYTLPSALSASVSTRVGNELGAGRPDKANLATVVATGMALLVSIFGFLWTTLGREAWGRVFTQDNEVLELTMAVLPIIGICELANCPQTTGCGVLRGSARPIVGAAINFYSFYLVGMPVAIILAFVWGLGFLGLCYGLLAAQLACVISVLAVIYRMNWNNESLKAKFLVEGSWAFAHAAKTVNFQEGVGSLEEIAYEK